MKIVLPPKSNLPSEDEKIIIEANNIVIIGANGAGKTRFGTYIELNNNNITHRISAQKSLSMPKFVRTTSIESAKNDLLFGFDQGNSSHKIGNRWGRNPNTHLLNDYEKLMVLLHTEEYEESVKFKDMYIPNQTQNKPITKLDRVQYIWEEVLPHRKLTKRAGQIETFPTENPEKSYNSSEMSDGERVIFYLIGEAVSVPENSILVIDEPEMHLHKSITNILWDKIEQERIDCTFVYLTHDIDFAFSRQNSTKIWAKSFDGNVWDYEILEDCFGIPEQLFFEVLGSRKDILFIEGDKSSIDYNLFQLVFPEFTIKPLGGCSKVIEVTKSFNDQKDFHQIQSFGLIDRDRRTREEIESITNSNIWVFELAEIENFFLIEDIIKIVAIKMNKDPVIIFDKVKSNVIDFFKDQLEMQITQHVAATIKKKIRQSINLIDIREFSDLENKLNTFWENQNFREIYDEIKSRFNLMVSNNNFEEILKVFNHKGLIFHSNVAVLNDINPKNNAYINFVLSILKEKSRESIKIQQVIKTYINRAIV